MGIIILNAPLGAGKDTIADILVRRRGFKKLEFKQRLYDIAKVVLGDVAYLEFRADLANRATKETPKDYLGGLSPRGFLIKISEDWVKPTLGDDYFGIAAGQAVNSAGGSLFVFSDGGFDEELVALRETTNIPIVLVRLHREGHSFEGDSRKYIDNYIAHATFDLDLKEGKPDLAVDTILTFLDFLDSLEDY